MYFYVIKITICSTTQIIIVTFEINTVFIGSNNTDLIF